jgi:cysteine synthase A
VPAFRALSGIEQAVGRTPLVRLDRLFPGHAVWAKLEALNPGGSAKDRSAVALVSEAMAQGRLRAGSILVESTSGNFGVALARLAARHGFRFRAVVDPRANPAATRAILALGGELELVTQPDAATGDWLVARIARVRQYLADNADAVWLDQYSNRTAATAHAATMAEILEALHDEVDAVLVATSTTGTIGGCLLQVRRRGLATRVFAVDATGSVLFGGTRGDRRLSGYGAGLVPALAVGLEPAAVLRVADADAVAACRALARAEGILAGASSGAVIGAATRLLPTLPERAVVALVLHDRGEAYLDTVYSDDWVGANLGVGPDELARRVAALTAR